MAGKWFKESIGARLLIIALLSLVLLIPSLMIQSLISEREGRRNEAFVEVSQKWGAQQIISGPILTVPYKAYFKNTNDELQTVINFAHFLPEDLTINTTMQPEIRNRGIYEIVLYNASAGFKGYFNRPDFSEWKIPQSDILWEDAFIAIGFTDMKCIKDLITIRFNNEDIPANPGVETNDVIESGMNARVHLNAEARQYNFSFSINLNGSEGLYFTPVGKLTNSQVASAWKDPSFLGEYLPDTRSVTEQGFAAHWKILHLNRNFPQKWIGERYKINKYSFGVNLLLPVNEYQKTMRTAKYAIMFIGLTFLSFFMIELLNRKILHPIQYLLIGFALLIFYTLLLSFSEHLLFQYAYLIAAIGIITLITAYTKSVLRSNRQTLLIFGILLLLYGYLYVILQLQDFALLMGSIGLFLILAVIMFLTRKIDWFAVMKNAEQNPG
jgi:inner membrane protein